MRFVVRMGLPALVLALALAACSKHHVYTPVVATPGYPAPLANSPANALRRVVWGWTQRDTTAIGTVLPEDFRFLFAPSDSAGNPFRDQPWTREDEMLCLAHLFYGEGGEPPASDISFLIDRNLADQPDPRPGRDPRWHRTVRTGVDIRITVFYDGTPTVTPITGSLLVYCVRGDSAVVPAAWRDSTRWFIDRVEDQTIGGAGAPGAHVLPTRNLTLGAVKLLYR